MGSGKMLLLCSLSVIISLVLAEEESIRVNTPIERVPIQSSWVQGNKDSIRCFCNLPHCVATGYLCKSDSGCFSHLLDSRSSTYSGRHGCIEFLSESQQSRCNFSNQPNHIHVQRNRPRSLLMCCTNHLCNHVDNPHTRNLLNFTFGEDESDDKFQQQNQEQPKYSNSDVWFIVATIVVPICGAVILFALIALAVKLLKTENQNSVNHKLGPAMYVVPSEQKYHNNKWPDHKFNHYVYRTPYYSENYPNAFASRPGEDVRRQIQMPLLITNDIKDMNNSFSENTNVINALSPNIREKS